MDNDKNIYDYVINSMNNILKNGIEYYKDKNKDIYKRLLDIHEYINHDFVFEFEKTKVNNEISEQVTHDRDIISDELLSDYMKKIMDIKISILNLENDLSLYHKYSDNIEFVENKINYNEVLEFNKPIEIKEDIKEIEYKEEVEYCDEFNPNEKKSLLGLFKKS